ncbi:hypothetical protein LOK49_LG06G03227 [Camellia lanceoleosa]|uniref:Uncharacterized protein n=1 Tax=Camellia lanceoleosa TaxID=1840588 RepID=A0ACC0HGL1_9ERIC|nr:hypothetical protein LOK49_LG06G03227 [Camellia lanceoleosa]
MSATDFHLHTPRQTSTGENINSSRHLNPDQQNILCSRIQSREAEKITAASLLGSLQQQTTPSSRPLLRPPNRLPLYQISRSLPNHQHFIITAASRPLQQQTTSSSRPLLQPTLQQSKTQQTSQQQASH